MKKSIQIFPTILLAAGLFFACRGGTHKNNDHDYDGRNENDDGTQVQQDPVDTVKGDSVSRYPMNQPAGQDTHNVK